MKNTFSALGAIALAFFVSFNIFFSFRLTIVRFLSDINFSRQTSRCDLESELALTHEKPLNFHFFCFYPQMAQCRSSPIENPTNFLHFPVELLLMINENLNVIDLINLTKAYPDNRHVLQFLFKDQFSKSEFSIHGWAANPKFTGSIVSGNRAVENIKKYDTFCDLFTIFGQSVHKLNIFHRPNSVQPKIINELINKFLSSSLTDIGLIQINDPCI